MRGRLDIVRRAEALLADPIEHMGYELVACDWRTVHGRQTLQVFVDRESGVGIQDCIRVTDGIGDLLDVEDFIPDRYNLEVSSPGLDRPLRKDADFERFAGQEVRIKTYEPIEGRKNFRGRIEGVADGIVTVNVDGQPHAIPVDAMERANHVYDHPRPGGDGKRRGRRKGR